uniref:Uncharacterized protein n=1 Tax=Globodera rostochiensis TaxID=31243 RepID=A0A914I1G0_GLORO
MDTNFENAQEEQQQLNNRILCLQRKCKQLEEINAQYCDEDDERLKQIDATEEEIRVLKRDNAFKTPSSASTSSSSSRSSSSGAGFTSLMHSVGVAADKNTFTLDSSSSSHRLDDEDANVVEGRDSRNFSDQDQQDSVGNARSGKLLSNGPEVGNFGGMSLVEELELAVQQQKMKEEIYKAQLEQHQQQNNMEEPELAVQHQQQNNNNNSHTPHGAPPRDFLLSLLILLFFFVLIVLVVPSVQRGQLVIRISVFFPSAIKLAENVLQSKVIGMEQQQHLQQQLVAALSERVEQLELELKETHTKFLLNQICF